MVQTGCLPGLRSTRRVRLQVLALSSLLAVVFIMNFWNETSVVHMPVYRAQGGAATNQHAARSSSTAATVDAVVTNSVLWPHLGRGAAEVSLRPGARLPALPRDQPMPWALVRCDPRSSTDALGYFAQRRWKQMRAVSPTCMFAGEGKFTTPIDPVTLRYHAEEYVAAARLPRPMRQRGPRGYTFCGADELHAEAHSATFLSTFAYSRNRDGMRTHISAGNDSTLSRELRTTKLRHPRCELPDPDRPYQWLVMLTAAALERGQAHPVVAFVGDSVHRNMMAAMMAVLRGQHDTVVDRQTHMPARYVLTTHGDFWVSRANVGSTFGNGVVAASESAALAGTRVLLELDYAATFGSGPSDVPVEQFVPHTDAGFLPVPTTVVLGGLMHVEPDCSDTSARGTAFSSWIAAVGEYTTTLRSRNQTVIFRAANEPGHRPPNAKGLLAFHDWKNEQYRALVANAYHHGSGFNIFSMSALEHFDAVNDGQQPMHPQLSKVDPIHYACVLHDAYPLPADRWERKPWECRALHERIHVVLAVAMTFARFVAAD
jgi:hypothetical protein